ncbi:MAG TPA: glycosyl hydrolase, partial [Terriglobales bacterium]|nr:glycosyl hydrolase [Terriglobales bacterium]
RPAIQYLNSNGGWAEGDETYVGPSRNTDAYINYYQRSRHIFGDLKMEILGPDGKFIDTVASSKHRGLNRATWSMRLKPPIVPPAAQALFAAIQGPRVVPGTYTVKMTKGDNVYTTPLEIVLDPRANYTVEDRKQQFETIMKVYNLMGHMSYGVTAIEGVRDSANARAAKLSEKDPLRAKLQSLSDESEKLRSKIVATKEGGAITGEERIREHLGELYGSLNQYDGKPTKEQSERVESLRHELEDVIVEFRKLTDTELASINTALKKKKMEAISVLSEADWQKGQAGGMAGTAGTSMMREAD